MQALAFGAEHVKASRPTAVLVVALAALAGLSSFGARAAIRASADTLGSTLAPVSRWRSFDASRPLGIHHEAGPPPAAGTASGPDVDVYRGLGTWIDLYDRAWKHPGVAVRRMRARGVRTLYLETSNFSRSRPFVYRDEVEEFLDAADRNGVAVVAWYLPGLRDLERDDRRSVAAIRLRTPEGNRFASFALDIESDAVGQPRIRTQRLLRLSRWIRREAGPSYSLGAIIPSPHRLEFDRHYWPSFPYERLRRIYDVFLPMTYFSYWVHGGRGASWYTAENIKLIRERTRDPSVPIHVIGGIAGAAGEAETRGFVHAVRERHPIGASYYTFPLTSNPEWSQLRKVPSPGR